MDYLATIENNDFFYWQIELLIESFKLLNLQDDLVVAVVTNNNKIKTNTKNLKQHKRKFGIKPYPNKYLSGINYPPINQSYIAYNALKENLIKQPFVILHADTVLVKPFDVPTETINFSANRWFISKLEALKCLPLSLASGKGTNAPSPLPMGGLYCFNNAPLELFERTMYHTAKLLKTWTKPQYSLINQCAWMMTFQEFHKINKIAKGVDVETSLIENINENTNIIHYAKGLPPNFSKNMFSFNFNFSFANDPLKILMEEQNNVSTSTNYLRKIIQSYSGESS